MRAVLVGLKDWLSLLPSLVRPPGRGRDAHGGKLLRLAGRDRSEGGEGDWRGGQGGQAVVVWAGQLVDHGVDHHLPGALRLDGRTVAQLGTVGQVGVAGGGV